MGFRSLLSAAFFAVFCAACGNEPDTAAGIAQCIESHRSNHPHLDRDYDLAQSRAFDLATAVEPSLRETARSSRSRGVRAYAIWLPVRESSVEWDQNGAPSYGPESNHVGDALMCLSGVKNGVWEIYSSGGRSPQTLCTDDPNNPSRVIDQCTIAIARNGITPTNRANYYFIRSNAYFDQENFDDARLDLDQVILIDREFPDAFSNRGLTHYMQEDYASAMADFNEAVGIGTRPAFAYNNRAMTHFQLGQYQEAWDDFNAAAQTDRNDAGYLYGRGLAALRIGRAEEGQADIDRALRLDPGVAATFEQTLGTEN